MSTTLTGAPKSVIDVTDASVLSQPSPKGYFCVQIATERGEPNKPIFISSDIEFFRKLGSYIDGMDGVHQAIKMLKRGAKLWVSRVAHYTNVSDKSTIVGTKAAVTKTVNTTSETLATGTFVVTSTGEVGDIIELVSNNGNEIISLGEYEIDGHGSGSTPDTNNEAATGIRAAINLLTGTHGYSASGSGANVIVSAPTGTGTDANAYVLGSNITGTATGTVTGFSGGVSTIVSGNAGVSVWNGKEIGPGYAGLVITVSAAKSGTSGKVDIKTSLPGYTELDVTVLDVSRTPTDAEIAALNLKLTLCDLVSYTTRLPYSSATLAGGTYDTSALTDNDYVGNVTAKTGLYSFDSVMNASRLANIERNVAAVDVAYNSYVVGRKNMLARLAIPKGLTFDEAKAYRDNGLIDSWQSNYVFGDVIYYDPQDVTKDKTLVGIGDVCGLRASVDSKFGEWISEAGLERGKIDQNKGLVRNLGAETASGVFDTVYEAGVNAVIVHESGSTVYWGNRSLLKDQTKLLSKQNIAELMIYIIRKIKPITDKYVFNPNDPLSWSGLYRAVKPEITLLENNRAIYAGEGKNWFWIGDQNADSIQDVTFNTPNEISAGRYRARFVFIPITAIEYIGIEVTSTDSGTLQIAVVQDNL